MSVRLRILSSVYEEVTDAFVYYENESPGLGDRFLENIDMMYEYISDYPLMYQINFDDVHRAVLTDFPYAIFFTYDSQEVTIHAIRHTKQDPRNLPKRN
jgi:plasmid stabilization system protein ParE